VHDDSNEDDHAQLRVTRQAARADGDTVRRAVDHEAERGRQPVRGGMCLAVVVLWQELARGVVVPAVVLGVVHEIGRVWGMRREVLDAAGQR